VTVRYRNSSAVTVERGSSVKLHPANLPATEEPSGKFSYILKTSGLQFSNPFSGDLSRDLHAPKREKRDLKIRYSAQRLPNRNGERPMLCYCFFEFLPDFFHGCFTRWLNAKSLNVLRINLDLSA
jgi:hypothetical protein